MKITIDKKNKIFLNKKKPFFLMADTCWSAFTNVENMYDWEYYLNKRQSQGFNAIQITVHEQHDRYKKNDKSIFGIKNNKIDFSYINEKYLDNAEEMIKKIVERNMIPILVPVWSNYIYGTWINKKYPSPVMNEDEIKNYIKIISKRFSKYNPMYFASGDTDFKNKKSVLLHNLIINQLKKYNKNSLIGLHPMGYVSKYPKILITNKNLDFITVQTGHTGKEEDLKNIPITMKKVLKYDQLISFNAEPAYESIGKPGNNRDFIRKTIFTSLLSGMSSGISYGAHGIWQWAEEKENIKNISLINAWGTSVSWRDAVNFDGAWDMSLIKHIFEKYNLTGGKPANDILNDNSDNILTIKSIFKDNYLFYIKEYQSLISLKKSMLKHKLFAFDFNTGHIIILPETDKLIRLFNFTQKDIIIIAENKNQG